MCSSQGILSAGTWCGYWQCYVWSHDVVCQYLVFFSSCVYSFFLFVINIWSYAIIFVSYNTFLIILFLIILLCKSLPNGNFSSLIAPSTCVISYGSTLRRAALIFPTYFFIQLFILVWAFILKVITHYFLYFLLKLSQIWSLRDSVYLFLCPFNRSYHFKVPFTVW